MWNFIVCSLWWGTQETRLKVFQPHCPQISGSGAPKGNKRMQKKNPITRKVVVIFEFDKIRIPTLHIGEGVWTPQAKYRRTNDDARKHTPTLLTTGHSTYEMEWLRRLPASCHRSPTNHHRIHQPPTVTGQRGTIRNPCPKGGGGIWILTDGPGQWQACPGKDSG